MFELESEEIKLIKNRIAVILLKGRKTKKKEH